MNSQEEVRVIIFDDDLCTDVAVAFLDAGIAAYGDYRPLPRRDLINDAINNRVDYIVFDDQVAEYNGRRKISDIRDHWVIVYSQYDQTQNIMQVSAAIELIKQRRSAK